MLILRLNFLGKRMFRRRFVLALVVLSLAACQKEKRVFTEAELRRRVDSAVKENTPLLREQFDEDLDRRMSIEVRPLADSLRRK